MSLTEALDLTTPAGRAMAAMLAVFAAFEREILQERTRAGLTHARQNGIRLGRPATAAVHAAEVRKLHLAGVSKSEIARRLQIGRASVRRILTSKRGLTMLTTNTVDKPHEIYQIKVTLPGTDPPIWRRLLVPADLTLEQLHDVLQLAMGWEDCHMLEFPIGQQRFGKPDPMERAFGGPGTASERTAWLFNVLAKSGHQIVVGKRLAPEPWRAYPACLAGERHGPPEDCGGMPGFYNLLEAISEREHERHEELLDWLGDGWTLIVRAQRTAGASKIWLAGDTAFPTSWSGRCAGMAKSFDS